MHAAGIRRFGGPVEPLDLPDPRELQPDEVLIEVRAAGVGNWDEFVRTGDWDTRVRPPMALGVEAAGVVTATGRVAGARAGTAPDGPKPGDRVTVHSVPLREQGCWAERIIAPVADLAVLPPAVSFEAGAALPVPALTADQVLAGALNVQAGQTVLVSGAGGVTGGLLVELAVHRGATVIATAGPDSADRILGMGATSVIDYHQPDWPGRVRSLTSGGADVAANAARSGSKDAIRAVRDGGRLATITSDPPAAERGITVREVVVAPDGARLGRLAELAADGTLTVRVAEPYPLDQAAAALGRGRRGAHGAAIVIRPAGSR